MKFSDYLWEQISQIQKNIVEHPFNVELAQGTLDLNRFTFYVEQDAFYLLSFSRALAFIGARATISKLIEPFLNFALEALIAERQLHSNFIPLNNDWEKMEPSPSCLAYTQYLIAMTATAPLEESIASIVPCFWIYREVGRTLAAHATKNNRYKCWIETYSSPKFSEGTELAIALLNESVSQCSTTALRRIENAFVTCSLFEWYFWDDAYHMRVFKNTVTRNRSSAMINV